MITKYCFISLMSSMLCFQASADIYQGFEDIGSGVINETSNPPPGARKAGLLNTMLSTFVHGPVGDSYEVIAPIGPHPDKRIGDNLFVTEFQRRFYFRLKHQKNRDQAHLVVFIPPFGAGTDKGVGPYITELLNRNGLVTLSAQSPANPDFIKFSSSLAIPGNQVWDAQDIYDAIQLAIPQLKKDFGYNFNKVSVIGASLGSLNAFHVLGIDLENQAQGQSFIGFHKVISINAPISNVYGSTAIDTFVALTKNQDKEFDFLKSS